MAIYPKCKNGDKLYVTPFGTLRPCCWIGEPKSWKTFDMDPDWDMNKTSLDVIKNVTLVEFAEKMKTNPMKVCKRMCSKNTDSISNPTQKREYLNEQ